MTKEQEEAEKMEKNIIQGINKSLGTNKFAEEIRKAYPNIPNDKLLSLTRSFLEKLQLLEKIYEGQKRDYIAEEIDNHIPHID